MLAKNYCSGREWLAEWLIRNKAVSRISFPWKSILSHHHSTQARRTLADWHVPELRTLFLKVICSRNLVKFFISTKHDTRPQTHSPYFLFFSATSSRWTNLFSALINSSGRHNGQKSGHLCSWQRNSLTIILVVFIDYMLLTEFHWNSTRNFLSSSLSAFLPFFHLFRTLISFIHFSPFLFHEKNNKKYKQ
jgi:hypothetical protein